MATDPWDVFGSDSDEDPSAATLTPTPAPVAAKHLPAAKRKQKQKRYAWEALLPTFRFPAGFDADVDADGSGGGGGSVEGQEADGGNPSIRTEATKTSAAAAAPARAPFSAPPVYQHPSVRYEPCLPHRGGGRGFMASTDIAPGTLLLVERRFLPMPTAVECGLAGGVGQEELCLRWILGLPSAKLEEVLGELRWLHPQSLEDLPESETAELMSRHEQTAKDMLSRLEKSSGGGDGDATTFGLDVRGIVRLFGALQSNGFASGIYLHPAMTNHSCRPNAIKWRAGQSISDRKPQQRKRQGHGGVNDSEGEESLLSEIRATELIREGEEITISYLEPREIALESRQSRLKDQFGFDCNCTLCEDSSSNLNSTNNTSGSSGGRTAGAELTAAAALEGFVERGRGNSTDEQQHAPVVDEAMLRLNTVTSEEPEEASDRVRGGPAGDEEGTRRGVGVEDVKSEGQEGEEEDDEEEDRGGLVARNVLERRLEAAESVVDLSRAKEVRWAGVLSEVLGYRRQAAQWLSARHISLARADKLVAKACIAILEGSTEAAQLDAECAESVQQTSDKLPSSFGGCFRGDQTPPRPLEGSFRTRLLAVFLSALISRRKTQILYLGDGPHPEAGACLADLSQAMRMLLAQGSEGQKWIERLPGFGEDAPDPREAGGGGEQGDQVLWLGGGGVSGASMFERECGKAATRIGGLFDAPQQQ